VVEQLRAVVDRQRQVEQAAIAAAERVPVAPEPGVTPEPAPPAASEVREGG
jgi:hypothetical protein